MSVVKKLYSNEINLRGSTAGSTKIQSASTTTSYDVTLPPAQGGVGEVLINDGTGALSWANAASSAFPAPAGSTAAPSVNFIGSTTTGLSASVADDLVISAAGVAVASITSTNFNIEPTTAAVSTTTGALTVAGGVGVAGDAHVGGTVFVGGDLVVSGTTTSIASENVLLADNFQVINAGYNTAGAQSGGIVVNYSPTGGDALAITSIDASRVVTVGTSPVATFPVGSLVLITGTDVNDGLFEVDATSATTITLKNTGLSTVFNGIVNTTTVVSGAVGEITPTAIGILKLDTDGAWKTSTVSSTGVETNNGTLARTNEASASFSAVTDQLVLGTTNTTTISAPAPAASSVYTIPDVGTSGAFVMNLDPTLAKRVVMDSSSGTAVTTIVSSQTAAHSFTIPDVASDTFSMLNAVQTLTNTTLNTTQTITTTAAIKGASAALIDTITPASATILTSSSSTALTADRTLTVDVVDANKIIKLGGDLTLADSLTTTGAFPLTLTQTAATVATLPEGTITLVDLNTAQTLTNKIVTKKVSAFTDAGTILATDAASVINVTPTVNTTLTLPTVAAAAGLTYRIILLSAFTLTITPDGAETIDGETSAILDTVGQHMIITSNGIQWYIM